MRSSTQRRRWSWRKPSANWRSGTGRRRSDTASGSCRTYGSCWTKPRAPTGEGPPVTGADTVFDDIFRLLTPDRLLRDPRATGEGVSVALVDSGVERSVLANKFGDAIYPIEGAVFRTDSPHPHPYTGHQSSPHGTTVADILLTIAPRIRLYSADVFGPTGTSEVDTVIR